MNALRSGATAKSLLLPGESAKDLAALEQGLRAALQPFGMDEEILVRRILAAEIRLRRIEAAERSVLARQLADRAVRRARRAAEEIELKKGFARPFLGDAAATLEEQALPSYAQLIAEEQKLAAIRDSEDADLGVAFSDAADELERLARHRTAAERSLDRALKMLDERQERRRAAGAAAGAATGVVIDVTEASAAVVKS